MGNCTTQSHILLVSYSTLAPCNAAGLMMGGVASSPVQQTSILLGRQTRERRPLETNKIEKGQKRHMEG